VRLDAYLNQTAPLAAYYEEQGKLVGVDGMADIETVARSIDAALGAQR
jgi:adenylate kinase